MVNSGSFDCDIDRNTKDRFRQNGKSTDGSHSPSLATATSVCAREAGFSETADSLPLTVIAIAHAIEPTANKTEHSCTTMLADSKEETSKNHAVYNYGKLWKKSENLDKRVQEKSMEEYSRPVCAVDRKKTGVFCSVPLDKVQGLISEDGNGLIRSFSTKTQISKKLLCLYCERSFVTTNLRQKHVDRCHSVKQTRSSTRRFHTQPSYTACVYCDKLNTNNHGLKELFLHLVSVHSNKYFACLPCEDRFSSLPLLNDHNSLNHRKVDLLKQTELLSTIDIIDDKALLTKQTKNICRVTRNKKTKLNCDTTSALTEAELENAVTKKSSKDKGTQKKFRELRSKKLITKSNKICVKRNTRLQTKIVESSKHKKSTKHLNKAEETSSKDIEKQSSLQTATNPYPQFDSYFQVKKITDHSIDNLRISTMTFDDVFDKAFYNRIKCNIQENLLNYIDGKLFKNEESESRISNFEKNTTHPPEILNNPNFPEQYGCDISVNAATPVATLLSSQFGEDLESQIEYGSKASKKKTQTRSDEVHYKYFTRRKYQASILESKENRDLSKLDMWTQLIIKNRQQKIANDRKSPKELLDYTKCQEYRTKMQQEELNRILDRRGPFEDLKEEATRKAALDKLNLSGDPLSQETFAVVTDVINDMVSKICLALTGDNVCTENRNVDVEVRVENAAEAQFASYLKLTCASSLKNEDEIDKSDKITLICSSQETEDFDASNVIPRNRDEMVELTGEWARTRIYICAACGLKVSNLKMLIEHKTFYHQNVWCQHYEFVGNQSELYRHLCIPGLGKVGEVENSIATKLWQRSGARLCSKCSKLCNSLGELHRHILECGGDWSWMLARKKCKYRPFGSKTRRKRRGMCFVHYRVNVYKSTHVVNNVQYLIDFLYKDLHLCTIVEHDYYGICFYGATLLKCYII